MRILTHKLFFVAFFLISLVLGIASFSYTVQKCGLGKAFLMGENGLFLAAAGFCDE